MDQQRNMMEKRPAAAREVMPHRRQNRTLALEFEGQRFSVTVGYYADGRPGEVFATGHRESQYERMLSDACVLISRMLQVGHSPSELAESLGTVPTFRRGEMVEGPASPLGLILEHMQDRPELAGLTRTQSTD